MKTLKPLSFLLLAASVLAQTGNPQSFNCDYHNYTFYRDGREYPNGKCYDIYTHPYWANGKRYVHKATMPCK